MPDDQITWVKAVSLNSVELCLKLIADGADVNDKRALANGHPLIVAASRGLTNLVEVLLAHGAAPDLVGISRHTALEEAIAGAHVGACKRHAAKSLHHARRLQGQSKGWVWRSLRPI